MFGHSSGGQALPPNPNLAIDYTDAPLRKIWLAGGCFWGVQAYLARIKGVAKTVAGYANGTTQNPTYQQIAATGHAETVEISYDPRLLPLPGLLEHFFAIIDPTLLNRQGNDRGAQYRTGIYYSDPADLPVIKQVIAKEQIRYSSPIVTQVEPLAGFWPAEEYHQDYLEKNPGGYCHVDFSHHPAANQKATLRQKLTPMQYHVTQENGTEPPFSGEYWNNHRRGIYLDVVTGQPLFGSGDKFDPGCGWPSFTRPLSEDAVTQRTDLSHGMVRTEVRSSEGGSHLGHVFDDGPEEDGGLRYCINSAALTFVPLEEMEERGFGDWIHRAT